MKSLTISILFFSITAFISSAFAVQHFTCFPDLVSTDRVVISLENDAEGTLFLTSGIDDWGNQDNSGVMDMSKTTENETHQIWNASNATSSFTVQIPKEIIGKNANDVEVVMILKNDKYDITQELDCYTRMY